MASTRRQSDLPDAVIVARIRAGDTGLFEELMRRYNQRVYRVARAIVRDETEAEDVMQQAYVQAFTHLDQFEDRAAFPTWLTRIAIHEALAHRRRSRRLEPLLTDEDGEPMHNTPRVSPDAERAAYGAELKSLIEASVDALPQAYRVVFVLREVEGLTTAETAAGLDLGEEAVKTRLHRARAMLRRELFARTGAETARAFAFHLSRCDRVVERVRAALALPQMADRVS